MAPAQCCLAVLLLFGHSAIALSADPAHGREHFLHWYPQYRKQLSKAINETCKAQYDDYVVDPGQSSP